MVKPERSDRSCENYPVTDCIRTLAVGWGRREGLLQFRRKFLQHLVMDCIWKMPGEKQSRMTFILGNGRWSFSKFQIRAAQADCREVRGGMMNSALEMLNLEQLWNIHIINFSLSGGSVQSYAFLITIKNKTRKPPQILHCTPLATSLYCIFSFFIAKLLLHICLSSLFFYFSTPLQFLFLTHTTIKTALSTSKVSFVFPNQTDIFLSSLYSVPQQYLRQVTCYLEPKIALAAPSGDLESEKE